MINDPKAIKKALMLAQAITRQVAPASVQPSDPVHRAKGGAVIPHKAPGGFLGQRAGFERPDEGVQDFTPPKLQGTQIVKEPGGQWLSGSVESALNPLSKYVNGLVYPEEILSNPSESSHLVQKAKQVHSVNEFVRKQLTRYVKNEMGTERDPVRALAERGILHVNENQLDQQPDLNYDPALGLSSQTDLGNAWEKASDLLFDKGTASWWKKNQIHLKNNPWLQKVDPNTEIHDISPYASISKNLGFDHLIDELHNSVDPESDLPDHLKLRHESLARMSVPQAVEHVHNINEWRKKNREDADKKKAFNPATYLHKDYPGTDYAWYELKNSPNATPAIPPVYGKGQHLVHGAFPAKFDTQEEAQNYIDTFGDQLREKNKNGDFDPIIKKLNQFPLRYGGQEDVVVSHGKEAEDSDLEEALKYEGSVMGHCVGGYTPEVASGHSRIFSLRNKKTGEPHVTIEAKPSSLVYSDLVEHLGGNEQLANDYFAKGFQLRDAWREGDEHGDLTPLGHALRLAGVPETLDIAQIKGKGNKKPVDRYIPYVQDFVKSGNWKRVEDLQNTGLRRMDELYSGLTDRMKEDGEQIPNYMTEEEFQAAENRHFPHAATGGAVIAKATGGEVSNKLMGINVRNDDVPYADHIVDGLKKYETRDSHSLKPYVGKRVAVVRTGQGPAQAIGEMTVGEPKIVGESEFRRLEKQHLVSKGSQFDIKPGGVKYLYPVIDPSRYEKPKSVGHGIVARSVNKATGGVVDPQKAIRRAVMAAHSVSPKEHDRNLAKFMEGAHPSMFDKSGKPRVFYHGSGRDIHEFDPAKGNPQAIFATHDPGYASWYAERALKRHDKGEHPAVYPVHINAKNPFDYENPKHVEKVMDLFRSLDPVINADRYHGLFPAEKEQRAKDRHKLFKDAISEGEWQDIENPAVQAAIRQAGFDAFHTNEEGFKNLAAFDPRQVKSAIGNRGTFDPQDPNITKAGGGQVKNPQNAINKALMVARQERKVGGKTKPLNEPSTSYFEIAPGKTWDPKLQESWERLAPQAKAEISNRMIEEFIPKWKKKTGIRGEIANGLGGYGGFTNPNYTFRPNNKEDLPAAMNSLGELFRQDAMMGAHHEPFEGSFPSGLIRIKLPKSVDEEKAHQIYKTLNENGLAEGHSSDLENGYMDILSGNNEEEAAAAAHKIDKLLNGKYTIHSYQTNISFPSHGEHYGRSTTPATERPDASAPNANDPLQAEAAERLKSLLEEAHFQGSGRERPVDFSSLESLSRIHGGRLILPGSRNFKLAGPEGTLGVQGAPGVSFRGKQPHEFTPADWGAFGEEHGVPTLGPRDSAKWNANLQKIKTQSGREVTITGGINSAEPFSYFDLLHLKSQGINPNDLLPEHHQAIHNRMISSMQPSGELSPTQVGNQMMFGMISPNQPLTPNELALQRIMLKGPRDIETLSSMLPYHYSEGTPSRDQLNHFSRAISKQLGLHAQRQGGIGASGSANYADIAEFAQKMRDRPDFFTFDPTKTPGNSPSEKWSNHVSKIINEVRGLSAKTGSLASVWQSPKDAAISAIDRHMATRFQNNVFENEAEQRAWQQELLKSFNAKRKKADRVGSFEQMLNTSGGRGHFVDGILAHVNNIPSAMTRVKKTGAYNPEIPEALRNVNWVSSEPEKMSLVKGPYVRALEQNAREAQAAGQGLFSNQWMLWDRIRNRLEPHEVLFPGLEKLPRMSLEQMQRVRNDVSKAGYLAESGEVNPLPSASHAGYFAEGGAAKEEKSLVDRAMHLVAHLSSHRKR